MEQDAQEQRDFFISYTSSDRPWAEWIAMQLEQNGYTVFIQAWDFRPGSNFVAEMDRAAKCAERTLLVLSPTYLTSDYAFAEWAAAFRRDPKGEAKRLLPVRVQPCEVDGLLGPIVYIDLVSLDEQQARERLLAGVRQGRAKPVTVAFPGQQRPPQSYIDVPFPGALPTIWNIPFARNPFFTGREDLLEQLHTQLHTTQTAAVSQPQAISGLGGIGKTQLAVEYAYRYGDEYQAVLWAKADTTEALNGSYTEIAGLLNLPQRDTQEQEVIVQAVKGWLSSKAGWLLILDNADDLALVPPFLPTRFTGHLLLTTRAQVVGKLARRLEVETMDEDVGALLLLRRAGLVTPDAPLSDASPSDRAVATQITRELDGLPLALDQAGAYIEATGCGLAGYQRLFQIRQKDLLLARGGITDDHPEPVATTWALSFERVEQQNPAAADLLRFCAFLAPDAIPEEILSKGAEALGETLAPIAADPFLLNGAIEALRAYSLIGRDPSAQTITMHRLVQAVVRESLPVEIQQQWIQRAVNAIQAAYPGSDFVHWPALERLLPHALICATWIEQTEIVTPEAASLLSQVGYYLDDRARFGEAESLHQRALAIREQQLGIEHPDTAQSLNDLALLRQNQGRYAEAELLHQRTLAIREKQLGADHLNTAQSLNNLALLYKNQGRYAEAEPLYQRALAICEKQLGAEHPDMAQSLNNLAVLYQAQSRYAEAEPLYQRALAIREKQLGAYHPNTALSLNNLAALCQVQGRYAEAEPLHQRALAIRERQLGADHPDTSYSLSNLALLYQNQGRYAEAEPLHQRALAIRERQLGADHPNTANSLNNLASLYRAQSRYTDGEPLYQRALAILEHTLGPEHPDTQRVRDNYAALLEAMSDQRATDEHAETQEEEANG